MPGGNTLDDVSELTREVSQMGSADRAGSLVDLLSTLESPQNLVANRSLDGIAIANDDEQIACSTHPGLHNSAGL